MSNIGITLGLSDIKKLRQSFRELSSDLNNALKETEESILSDAQNVSLNQLKFQIKEKYETLFTYFDATMINRIDTLYSQLMLFKAFCEYDYFFMLKKL